MIAIGITINDLRTELADYTTSYVAMHAANMGHQVWYVQVADFQLGADNTLRARAIPVSPKRHRTTTAFLRDLQQAAAKAELIDISRLDVLWLRNDPSEDAVRRPWARMAAINFGRLARESGTLVVNDPDGMVLGISKLYMHYFPQSISPRTLVSRDRVAISAFIDDEGGWAVLKPMSGSGGHNVFLVQPDDVLTDRPERFIAQEYIPEAKQGDTRLFLMNGRPLRVAGQVAAMRRVRRAGDADMRSNMSAGAISMPATITDSMLTIAETVRPRLEEDGIFLAGLDIVDGKLLEINVQSPGGLHSASEHQGVNFIRALVESLERKVDYLRRHGETFDNARVCVMPD